MTKAAERQRCPWGATDPLLRDYHDTEWGTPQAKFGMAAADVGDELVHHVEARHLLEDLDEAGARVALVADEEQPGVELHALAPGRPALGRDSSHAVVVGIERRRTWRAVVASPMREAHMGILRHDRIAVGVLRVEVDRLSNSALPPSGAPEYLSRPIVCSWKATFMRSQCSSAMRMRRTTI
jgi:hypothetical protein